MWNEGISFHFFIRREDLGICTVLAPREQVTGSLSLGVAWEAPVGQGDWSPGDSSSCSGCRPPSHTTHRPSWAPSRPDQIWSDQGAFSASETACGLLTVNLHPPPIGLFLLLPTLPPPHPPPGPLPSLPQPLLGVRGSQEALMLEN